MNDLKPKKLGRGLGALLSPEDFSILNPNSKVRMHTDYVEAISVDLIDTNPYQPRTDFDDDALAELSESIQMHGLIQPITIRPVENGRYQLIAGERRLRASKLAGYRDIYAYIRTADEMQAIQMALVENLQREDLNALEIAYSYKRLMDEFNLTQEELSKRVSKNRSTIANFLRLLNLSKETQAALRDDKITMGHARAIVGLEDFKLQNMALAEVINKQLSVRQTESLIKQLFKNQVKPKVNVTVKLPQSYLEIKSGLMQKFNSKIEISRNLKGEGKLMIHFKTDEDFQRILKQITGE